MISTDLNKTRIVCAAIKFSKTDVRGLGVEPTEVIVPMIRHYDRIGMDLLKELEDSAPDYDFMEQEQGFLTNFGEFVDRKEALKIAKHHNQIINYAPFTEDNITELFSENLY